MNLLHKYTKLVVAAHDPAQVVYCNRKDPASLTPAELLEWADELGMNYLTTGATRGAMLKLSDHAMAAVSPIVHLAETFVLGHEAGHYLAGHLEDDARFSADEEVRSLEVFAENERDVDAAHRHDGALLRSKRLFEPVQLDNVGFGHGCILQAGKPAAVDVAVTPSA
jgi:hypothetical protein